MLVADASSPTIQRASDRRELLAPLYLSGKVCGTLMLAFLMLGVMSRATRYLQSWEPWGDETALIINVLERDSADLLRPLDNCQIAPIGYLWTAKAASLTLGINELSLRLPSFVCSVLTLFLTLSIARTVGCGWTAALAVGVLAVSNFHVRHSAEMKQYAMECFITAALVALALSAASLRPAAAWGLLALTPIAMLTSMTAAFVVGGISLSLLPTIHERRSWRWWCWYGLYNAVVGLSFLAVYFLVLQPQVAVQWGGMEHSWGDQMPVWNSPSSLLKWLTRTATGSIFAHPFGGEKGESLPFAILFWIGVIVMWRRGDRLLLRMLAGVVGLAAVAALLRRYPLGGHPRMVLYLSPLVVVPIAAGMTALFRFRAPNENAVQRRGWITVGLLATIGLIGIVKDLAKPYHNLHSRNRRDFARWFWTDHAHAAPGPMARVTQDGILLPGLTREHGYLHERYCRSQVRRLPSVPDHIDQPTGLVMCTLSKGVDFKAVLSAWRAKLEERYEVFDHKFFELDTNNPVEATRYDVLWIRPSPRTRPAESPKTLETASK